MPVVIFAGVGGRTVAAGVLHRGGVTATMSQSKRTIVFAAVGVVVLVLLVLYTVLR